MKKRAVGASPLMAARTFAMTMPTCIPYILVLAGSSCRHLRLSSLRRCTLSCSMDKAQIPRRHQQQPCRTRAKELHVVGSLLWQGSFDLSLAKDLTHTQAAGAHLKAGWRQQ